MELTAHQDPTIVSINEKRQALAENIYSKNLRQMTDRNVAAANSTTHDQSVTDFDQANASQSMLGAKNKNAAGAAAAGGAAGPASRTVNALMMAAGNKQSMSNRENTLLSLESFDYDHTDQRHYGGGKNQANAALAMMLNDEDASDVIIEGGGGGGNKQQLIVASSYNDDDDDDVLRYVKLCNDLNIVPCSIIIKSLPTTSINMSNYGLNSMGILALVTILKTNMTVTRLDLSGNEIGSSGLKHLASLFEENSTISELCLSNIGTVNIHYLLDIFKLNRALRQLDLSANAISDEDGVLLIHALEDHSLATLDLSHNELAEKSGVTIGKWLAENGSLVELNLSWNHLRRKGALAIAKGIWDNNKLSCINLAWNGFGNEGAEALGRALIHNMMLEKLDLRSNRIGPKGFLILCSCFKDNSSLKTLVVARNHLTTEVVEAALSLLKSCDTLSLTTLDISDITLHPKIFEQIDSVKQAHGEFKCVCGFLNFGERKTLDPLESAIGHIKRHCEKTRMSVHEFFASLDMDGSMVLTYDKFKEAVKTSGLTLKAIEVDAMIGFLDRKDAGEINFNEILSDEKFNAAMAK